MTGKSVIFTCFKRNLFITKRFSNYEMKTTILNTGHPQAFILKFKYNIMNSMLFLFTACARSRIDHEEEYLRYVRVLELFVGNLRRKYQ
ncbi:hypothetical protein Avbf_14013 [Armadillidium vulgare]|nr:hypothetical protein Avbf_14013 [Armadillidium vulgare]